jgi:gliding motility-associated lipoprotein GldH
MMRSAPWWSVVALLLVGCAGNVVYQDSVPVPDGAWDRALAPEFAFDITDTISEHNVYIDVRHTGDYPFSDLFLFVDLWGPAPS